MRVEIGISRTIGSIVETSVEAFKPFLRRVDKVEIGRIILRSLIVPPKLMIVIDAAFRLLNEVYIALYSAESVLPVEIGILAFLCKRIDIFLLHMWWLVVASPCLGGFGPKLANRYRCARRAFFVDVHAFRVVDCAVGGLLFAAVTHVLVECLLAVRDAVRVSGGFFGLLLLDLLVCLGLGYDVCQEFEVLDAGNSVR